MMAETRLSIHISVSVVPAVECTMKPQSVETEILCLSDRILSFIVIVAAVSVMFVFVMSSAKRSTEQHYCNCRQFHSDSCLVVCRATVRATWSYSWISGKMNYLQTSSCFFARSLACLYSCGCYSSVNTASFFGPGCCCCFCCCYQFSRGPKMPKTFLIRIKAQQNFAYTSCRHCPQIYCLRFFT